MKITNFLGIVLMAALVTLASRAENENPNAPKAPYKPVDAAQCLTEQQCKDICVKNPTADMDDPDDDSGKDKKVTEPDPKPEPQLPPKMPEAPKPMGLDMEPSAQCSKTQQQCLNECPNK